MWGCATISTSLLQRAPSCWSAAARWRTHLWLTCRQGLFHKDVTKLAFSRRMPYPMPCLALQPVRTLPPASNCCHPCCCMLPNPPPLMPRHCCFLSCSVRRPRSRTRRASRQLRRSQEKRCWAASTTSACETTLSRQASLVLAGMRVIVKHGRMCLIVNHPGCRERAVHEPRMLMAGRPSSAALPRGAAAVVHSNQHA